MGTQPTQEQIDKVKQNLSNLIDLNKDILTNGNIKIENAYLLLSMTDNKDLGVQIGINLLDGAFWGAAAINGGFLAAMASNFCCGVVSNYSHNTPPSLQSSVANLENRLQVTSAQLQYDLQTFYEDPTTYWNVVYSGNVVNAFGTYSVSGQLSDLANVDVPSQNDTGYTLNLVKAVYGLDQVIWDNLLENFVITEFYPSDTYYVKNGYTEQKMIDSANGWCLNNPAWWRSWVYEQAKGFWGGDKSAYWVNNWNIGTGWEPFNYGNLSIGACNYLFSTLYDNTPNPNMTIGGGLYTRDFVFNHMPKIKKTSHTFNY